MSDQGQHEKHNQRAAVFVALQMFNLVLVLLQLWLLVSAFESMLDGKTAMALPAAIISAVCAGANMWMLVGMNRIDRSANSYDENHSQR